MILSKQKIRQSSAKGSILVFALIILSLILVSALSMAATTLTQLRATNVTGRSTAAIQNADQGVEIFLQQIFHERSMIEELGDIVGSGALSDLRCESGRIVSKPGVTSPFEIVASRKSSASAPPSAPNVEVTDCNTLLGDIAQFKVIGADGQAARALGVQISDSIDRGLIGYWGFEDNARAQTEFGLASGGSPTVSDGSRLRHNMTLCPVDGDPHGTSIPFARCPQIPDPVTGDINVTPAPSEPIDSIYMDHNGTHLDASNPYPGAFVAGIVDEEKKLNGADTPPQYHSQAIYFNGTSTYLAINDTEDTTPDTDYYRDQNPNAADKPAANFVDPADSKLSPEEAIAISLFVKKDSPGGEGGALVVNGDTSNTTPDYGYSLVIDDSNTVQFRVQGNGGDGTASAPYPAGGGWHHIVVMWDSDSPTGYGLNRPQIYIDGSLRSVGGAPRNNAMRYDATPFTVGGIYNGSDINVFEADAFGSGPLERGFRGAIDELRIYDRALTPKEIMTLCSKAQEPLLSNCNTF